MNQPPAESDRLAPHAFKTVCEYAVAHLIPPEEAVREFAGIPSREPFLLPRDRIYGRKEIDRFLRILSLLYTLGKRRFEEAAPTVRGTRRVYFGRTADEVYSSGSTNLPAKIPDAPWYVSSNNDGSRKASIVYDLMCRMQFSTAYAYMVSSLCFSPDPMLPWEYAQAFRQIGAA
jgi:hypothetical protein